MNTIIQLPIIAPIEATNMPTIDKIVKNVSNTPGVPKIRSNANVNIENASNVRVTPFGTVIK